jgi:hypothetical protein
MESKQTTAELIRTRFLDNAHTAGVLMNHADTSGPAIECLIKAIADTFDERILRLEKYVHGRRY